MTYSKVAVALLAAVAMATASAQTAAPKAAPKAAAPAAAPTAPTGKALYPQAQYDLLLKERISGGAQDTQELRNAVREELNTRELLAREAKKGGLDKQPDVKTQMDLASQTVLVRAFNGGEYHVRVLAGNQFEYAGKRYGSLSMVARKITGSQWSGPRFFGLTAQTGLNCR